MRMEVFLQRMFEEEVLAELSIEEANAENVGQDFNQRLSIVPGASRAESNSAFELGVVREDSSRQSSMKIPLVGGEQGMSHV